MNPPAITSVETAEKWQHVLDAQHRRPNWRCLSELLDEPSFREALQHEFASDPTVTGDALTRRGFLHLLGASVALAGLNGCSRAPSQPILPYNHTPPEIIPGIPNFYATSMVVDGYATGILAESHEGRPTKIEGNPNHPASLGASGVFEQALVLQLYDPSRARLSRYIDEPRAWQSFTDEFGPRADGVLPGPGARGLRFLMEPTSSPLHIELIQRVRQRYPDAQFHFYSPLARHNVWEGTRTAFGRALEPIYDLRAADVIVALDSDFLTEGPGHLRHARDFADRRRVTSPNDGMNRLYAVEARYSLTGAAADHRLRRLRSEVRWLAAALFANVASPSAGRVDGVPSAIANQLQRFGASGELRHWIETVSQDLRNHAGTSVVIAGDGQPPEVHAIAHLLNHALGNVGHTVTYVDPSIFEAGQPSHDLRRLTDDIAAGAVETLLILEGNPCYNAPADLDFKRRLESVTRRAYFGLYENETAAACPWFLAATHPLEAWGDARAIDGTLSIIQPLISPLYDGNTMTDVLAAFLGRTEPDTYSVLQDSWRARTGGAAFAESWERTLRDGFVTGSNAHALDVIPRWSEFSAQLANIPHPTLPEQHTVEIAFYPDHRVHDGRFTNVGWLLEFPDPMTRLTWDNAAIVSPATAATLGLTSEDVVALSVGQRRLQAAVWVLPGHADGSISLELGWGRTGSETLARDAGFNAFTLRTTEDEAFASGATITRLGEKYSLASTQTHWTLDGRPIAPEATLEQFRTTPGFVREQNRPTITLYNLAPAGHNQWAMAIDLSLCTGCGGCVVACQAENNSPIVGKVGVLKGREMHWLRIDRYFTGGAREPSVTLQPMLCQHCERAPCEYVCPVNATTHSADGLNEMTYNRCIGTRFCSNNCPYKVRRFNYFHYNRDLTETQEMVMNPDVTVRSRGVMEKCTFCVQRIRETEIRARAAQRPIADGEVQTACEQACASRAIVFGNLADSGSRVTRLHRDARAYAVLHELGTEPRVRYLAKLTNPNPAMVAR